MHRFYGQISSTTKLFMENNCFTIKYFNTFSNAYQFIMSQQLFSQCLYIFEKLGVFYLILLGGQEMFQSNITKTIL